MNILFLNTTPNTGGAAIAASRIAKAVEKKGIHTDHLYRPKNKISFLRFLWERLIIFISNGFNREKLFQVSIANTGRDISKLDVVQNADIIHMHWINQGFLSLTDLDELFQLGKPIVWTMHDMWPCTGICHHSRECEKYQTRCNSCPFLRSNGQDISTSVFKKKEKIYKKGNITFVGCSQWLSNRANKSLLLKNKDVVSIPNPIDSSHFYPTVKEEARKELRLPCGKILILFGAANISNRRKGIDYLIKSLKMLKNANNIELVVFGQTKEDIQNLFPLTYHHLGYLSDTLKIMQMYNASDIFVTPSLEENLPNTIMEAMACGTPCVGFNVGGIPEMIDHLKNGYVAKYKDADDLAAGIEWVIENRETMHLSEACVKKVKENYTEEIVADKYIKLYKSLLQNH